ncbi:scaffolding protein [Paenibacillus sp. ACRRY]|uniref:phage scaffolding protein n=1 Tax=Paenibacillus sp. ACRRY TaxID=2918208 RepID=UPI001EF6EB03|nr:scaffolding protein [Paenibacillus sp. ACRRY]MCG7383396.1 scaffolding protein [Paenibacillus sp. ACRRY]
MTDIQRKYPLNLQLFAEGDPDPQSDPQDLQADPQPKAFNQDEVDRMIADRLKRERSKYADYEELKRKVTENEKAEEERKRAELSVTERLEAEKAEALERAQQAEQAKEAALSAANQRLIKAEFKAVARELNVRADALDDVLLLADKTSVSVDENGNPVGVEDAVKALLTNKPYLVDAPKKPQPIGDTKPNPGDDERRTLEQQLSDARKSKDFAKVIELSNKLSK